jgi:hypothetical protein
MGEKKLEIARNYKFTKRLEKKKKKERERIIS